MRKVVFYVICCRIRVPKKNSISLLTVLRAFCPEYVCFSYSCVILLAYEGNIHENCLTYCTVHTYCTGPDQRHPELWVLKQNRHFKKTESHPTHFWEMVSKLDRIERIWNVSSPFDNFVKYFFGDFLIFSIVLLVVFAMNKIKMEKWTLLKKMQKCKN